MPKVLIVDDDPIIRNLLTQILEPFEDRGVRLLTAENGLSAIDIARKENPEIIFLDVMMPKMNGFEVCNLVKNDAVMRKCCVIMVTAKGQELDRQKATGVGADFYITKPFNIYEIITKVGEILGIDSF
ncbi:MAG: response regulator [Nitrospirota bacterium]